MLAGARGVAFGATIMMVGLFAVMLAEHAWIVTSLLPLRSPVLFDQQLDPWSAIEGLASNHTQSLIGAALIIWLAGLMVRRALRR
jgi:hypothetical protein